MFQTLLHVGFSEVPPAGLGITY